MGAGHVRRSEPGNVRRKRLVQLCRETCSASLIGDFCSPAYPLPIILADGNGMANRTGGSIQSTLMLAVGRTRRTPPADLRTDVIGVSDAFGAVSGGVEGRVAP
jgi:hypothetical protein